MPSSIVPAASSGPTGTTTSAWDSPDEARAAARDLRASGAFARVTREKRPLRAFERRPDGRWGNGMFRAPPGSKYMWIVWSFEPARAAAPEETAS